MKIRFIVTLQGRRIDSDGLLDIYTLNKVTGIFVITVTPQYGICPRLGIYPGKPSTIGIPSEIKPDIHT